MRVLVAIDDTDNLDSRGTGELASLIADAVQQSGWGAAGFITRHQLLVHPDIPYTSHNSTMCFAAEIAEDCLDRLIAFGCDFLERECAEGSDPGLCIAVPARIESQADLVDFGRRAKQEIVTKQEALDLAARLGVHLSEHGGTGHGVIGALAGVGLRLWGNDGRMRGSLNSANPGQLLRVRELLDQPDVDAVRCLEGDVVEDDDVVYIGEKPKTVLLDGASVLLVSAVKHEGSSARWETAPRRVLRGY
jgi:hypothetical protein